MIPVPNDVFTCLAKKFSFEPGTLTRIGGGRENSDGAVYATGNEPRRTLKITAHKINDTTAHVNSPMS